MQSTSGIINVYKPEGMTCADLVNVLKAHFKIAKAGYAGTLDKFAEGVLPVLLNRATKIARFIGEEDKEYEADVRLGLETDTGDPAGAVISRGPGTLPDAEELKKVFPLFTGKISQLPPEYSAIKVKGRRASDLARRGEKVDLKPRAVTVHSIELIRCGPSPDLFTVRVKCSKGTYIRALARDIGRKLGTGAMLTRLVRTRNGPFSAGDSVRLEEIRRMSGPGCLKVYSMNEALKAYPALVINDPFRDHVRNGRHLDRSHFSQAEKEIKNGICRITDKEERLLAVVEHADGKFTYLKVLDDAGQETVFS